MMGTEETTSSLKRLVERLALITPFIFFVTLAIIDIGCIYLHYMKGYTINPFFNILLSALLTPLFLLAVIMWYIPSAIEVLAAKLKIVKKPVSLEARYSLSRRYLWVLVIVYLSFIATILTFYQVLLNPPSHLKVHVLSGLLAASMFILYLTALYKNEVMLTYCEEAAFSWYFFSKRLSNYLRNNNKGIIEDINRLSKAFEKGLKVCNKLLNEQGITVKNLQQRVAQVSALLSMGSSTDIENLCRYVLECAQSLEEGQLELFKENYQSFVNFLDSFTSKIKDSFSVKGKKTLKSTLMKWLSPIIRKALATLIVIIVFSFLVRFIGGPISIPWLP